MENFEFPEINLGFDLFSKFFLSFVYVFRNFLGFDIYNIIKKIYDIYFILNLIEIIIIIKMTKEKSIFIKKLRKIIILSKKIDLVPFNNLCLI